MAVVVFVCHLSAAIAFNSANVARNVNLKARDTFEGMFNLDARDAYHGAAHPAFLKREHDLDARGLPAETVTVTVTTTAEYCSAATSPVPGATGNSLSLEIQTTPIPAGSSTPSPETPIPAGSSTPSPETPVIPTPSRGLIPYPVASLSSGSPVLPVSALPTQIVGANTTVTTSSLSATKSIVTSKANSLTSATALSSAPAASSTSAPNGGLAKDSNMNRLLSIIILAFSGSGILLL
ncbi:hypothetical protein MMC29_001415 [Sticta canariensis]|nr:hypothetical protein [Sticta canariensis]